MEEMRHLGSRNANLVGYKLNMYISTAKKVLFISMQPCTTLPNWQIHPKNLTWNLKMMASKKISPLLLGAIFRSYVCFGGCNHPEIIRKPNFPESGDSQLPQSQVWVGPSATSDITLLLTSWNFGRRFPPFLEFQRS